ncbi:MAG: Spy/CpxP family protein refolding chaperone [Spirulinaceae cyanobacterium]
MSIRNIFALSALSFFLSTGVSSAEPLNPNFDPGTHSNRGQMAQNRGGRRGGPDAGGRFLQQLNLTSEQQQQIQSIRDKYKGQMDEQRDSMQAARQQLGALMASDASVEQLRAQHNEVMRLQQNMANLRFESMLETRQVLTPTQRQELSQMTQERRNNRPQGFRGSRQ